MCASCYSMTSSELARRAYAFWIISRAYWLVNAVFAVTIVSCSATAAVLSAQSQALSDVDQKSILALSIVSAVVTSIKAASGFAENSQACRDVSRSLDALANDLRKGRLTELQCEKRLINIRRRVPLGTCLFLRLK